MDPVFDALGDSCRRRILVLLTGTELAAGAIVDALNADRSISQPAVSQHLRTLRQAGLVTMRAEGNRRLYAIDPDGISRAHEWLSGLVGVAGPLAAFEQPLDALATEVARGKRTRRGAAIKSKRSA